VTLCLVTDRRRLGGEPEAVVAQARAAAAAGVDLIQIRERDLDAAALVALACRVIEATRGSRTRVVINDRLDVALTCGADGVHLRGDSVPTSAARRLAPRPFLVGRSVHTVSEAGGAGDVDWLIAGTAFPSTSKPGADGCLGVDGLRAIVAAACAPVLAIGGIALDNVDRVAETGAAGIAAIGLFATIDARAIATAAACARQRFDSVRSAF
jgi:thiamine-phosphate pyrophosphorylase